MAEVHVRTLKRAAALVGGEAQLALRLKVTPSHLALWLQALEMPPDDVFLRAVDIVMEAPTEVRATSGIPQGRGFP